MKHRILFRYLLALLAALAVLSSGSPTFAAEQRFTPPASPRTTFNFNPGWKFIKGDVADAEKPDFDDSKWATVSTPHTYNDVDSFDRTHHPRRRGQPLHGPRLRTASTSSFPPAPRATRSSSSSKA